MAKKNRDDFTPKTKLQIAKRAGWHCSDPSCRRLTIGANSDGTDEINLGLAAHICAAAPGGPRYDHNQSTSQRSSADNGIWMCRLHGAAVDARDSKFSIELLREWKAQAQRDAWQATLYGKGPLAQAWRSPTESELNARVRAAAAADLGIWRRSDKWPSTGIALRLEVEGLNDPLNTSALATVLTTLDDLILVAPPGMGKTTTLFQIAEAMLAKGQASPIVVPLGDWSTEDVTLLESVLKRPAFRGISEDDLRFVATKPGLILLLDGWNELDMPTRKRAAVQVSRLQAELPELSLLISTRKQTLDVPIAGISVNLLPLSETQQIDIAQALRGDAGLRVLDQAWRTSGVRELVTIPLYLTALLALPEGAPFPTTKEEVLRRFVAVHEEDMQRAEALAEVTDGLHQRFLEDLAAIATRTVNTTISDAVARKCVSETGGALVAEGQITERPQPNNILGTLVSHHMLLRIGDPIGYSFQHQQFQEWYASHFVERLMMANIGDTASHTKLKTIVLDQPAWEESILFACERLARGNLKQQESCGSVIMDAFEVDPMLASEMIFRSTESIWARVGSTIQKLMEGWHTPGKIDRALRFMIGSGRPEFVNLVWPLITHQNDQVHLAALRAGRLFRPSLLGGDAAKRIAALPSEIRSNILHEIAFNSGMDGLDLAATIAKYDPDPEVKVSVIDALTFRRADRHVADVLHWADERTFDLVVSRGVLDEATDERVKEGIEAARERWRKKGVSIHDRLHAIVYAQGNQDLSGQLTTIIAEMEIDKKEEGIVDLIYLACSHYPQAMAEGLLQRLRAGRTLFYGADNLLASANFSLEDDALLEVALSETSRRDARPEVAASVLGPQTVGRLIDAVLEAKKHVRDSSGKYDEAAGDRYHALLARIEHTSGASLLTAISARSAKAGDEEVASLARLICRHPNGENNRGRPFDPDSLSEIRSFVINWGSRLLTSGDATRSQLAAIAALASRAPSEGLLPLLKRLLDEELRRYRAFREQAAAMGWRRGEATNEARTPYTNVYRGAFDKIKSPSTAALMCRYLEDEHFGQAAALVLAAQWTAANEPGDQDRLGISVDFSRVEERRAARASNPAATLTEANAIFDAIEPLISPGATEEQNKHAVALGIVAARLPHGQRDATIKKLISVASRTARAALLQNLILGGECIELEMVKDGIAEIFEASKTEPWILSDGYELRAWLRLLPFATPIGAAFDVVRSLPEDQRRGDYLEEMIACFGMASGNDAENVLFKLPEADPLLYASRTWRDAVKSRGTLSAARRFVDLVANGAFEGNEGDHWSLVKQLGDFIGEHAELRRHVYQLLKGEVITPSLALLAQAIAENPDAEGLLLLVKIEIEHKLSLISRRTIENVVTERVPHESWKGAFEVVPITASELRRKLLLMTGDGGRTDIAARCLNQIDEIRDEYGAPDSEPRHPDLASGKRWPVMRGLE